MSRPRRAKRRVPVRHTLSPHARVSLSAAWSLEFVHDVLYDGCKFLTLIVLDEGNGQAPIDWAKDGDIAMQC